MAGIAFKPIKRAGKRKTKTTAKEYKAAANKTGRRMKETPAAGYKRLKGRQK